MMYKPVVLCLIAAAALVWAGSSIDADKVHGHRIPAPEPGVFPEIDMPAPSRASWDTLCYDDNIPGFAHAWTCPGYGWGVKFISPDTAVSLAGALIHFAEDWPQPGGNRVLVKVFADDGPEAGPGTELWSSDTLTITRGQWNYVSVRVRIVGSDFYVFYVQADSYPGCPGLSIDRCRNAPSSRQWECGPGGFHQGYPRGDWLIRAVIGWGPQEHNATVSHFVCSVPAETVPGCNIDIVALVRNLGFCDLEAGTPVRLRIAGPDSYRYDDTTEIPVNLPCGQERAVSFTPAWRVPRLYGRFRVQVWTEAALEQWPADDTITRDLNVAYWIEYANFNNISWVSWVGPERATKFNPPDFGVEYPAGLYGARAQFYQHPQYPWPDSSFMFKVYGDDGLTLLHVSDTLEALPGVPGPPVTCYFDSVLVFESGQFYVSIDPVHPSGFPSSVADDTADNRSFYGAPGSWASWTMGEFFISAGMTPS